MRGERGERETYLVCGVSVPHNQFSVLRSTDKVPRMQSQREREREITDTHIHSIPLFLAPLLIMVLIFSFKYLQPKLYIL